MFVSSSEFDPCASHSGRPNNESFKACCGGRVGRCSYRAHRRRRATRVPPNPKATSLENYANNEGIFVDGKTFKIARGKAKGEPSAQIARLGAKEVGPGAIIFPNTATSSTWWRVRPRGRMSRR